MSRDRKPELYFRHKDIINQIQLDKPSFSLYLHENMLDFFTDIGDIADCLEIYSNSDFCERMITYSYDVSMALLDIAIIIHIRAAGLKCNPKLNGYNRVQLACGRPWPLHVWHGKASVLRLCKEGEGKQSDDKRIRKRHANTEWPLPLGGPPDQKQ